MKIDFYHHNSDLVVGDTISRLPILDWEGWYGRKLFEYKHRNPGFTGKYNDTLYMSIVICRYRFCLRIDLNYGATTPELAKTEYHARRKNR